MEYRFSMTPRLLALAVICLFALMALMFINEYAEVQQRQGNVARSIQMRNNALRKGRVISF